MTDEDQIKHDVRIFLDEFKRQMEFGKPVKPVNFIYDDKFFESINIGKPMNQQINFNELSKQIFEQNKAVGWWDDMDRCIYQTLQLVSTEIAEATEGERKNLMDDKLPHRRMGEVELADALIRVLDLAGRYGWQYYRSSCNLTSTTGMLGSIETIAGLHFVANKVLVDLGMQIFRCGVLDSSFEYTQVINVIIHIGKIKNYDIIGAVYEKLEFNKTRPDHQRENRALENGKKF